MAGVKHGDRYRLSITIDEETLAWVEKIASEHDLPVSRVVCLCIQGERSSLVGKLGRGLVKGTRVAKSSIVRQGKLKGV